MQFVVGDDLLREGSVSMTYLQHTGSGQESVLVINPTRKSKYAIWSFILQTYDGRLSVKSLIQAFTWCVYIEDDFYWGFFPWPLSHEFLSYAKQ